VAVRKSDKGKVVWAARPADNEYRTIEVLGFVNADEVIPSLGEKGWGYVPFDRLRNIEGDTDDGDKTATKA
jgi:hypothetical protein